jgi:type I restriction enzyme R subunit
MAVDEAVRNNKPDSWVGNRLKERRVKLAVQQALPENDQRLDELFDLLMARHEYH